MYLQQLLADIVLAHIGYGCCVGFVRVAAAADEARQRKRRQQPQGYESQCNEERIAHGQAQGTFFAEATVVDDD